MEEESKFAAHTEDLIAIHERPRSMVRRFCDPWIARLSRSLLRIVRRNESLQPDSVNEETVYSSDDDVVDLYANTITFGVGLSLLVAPLWILQTLKNLQWKLGVITICIVIFVLVLALATTGTPNQIMAATAG